MAMESACKVRGEKQICYTIREMWTVGQEAQFFTANSSEELLHSGAAV